MSLIGRKDLSLFYFWFDTGIKNFNLGTKQTGFTTKRNVVKWQPKVPNCYNLVFLTLTKNRPKEVNRVPK